MRSLIVMFLLFAHKSFAVPVAPGALFTYEGILSDAQGPISSPTIVDFQIFDGSCMIYSETQSISPSSQGEFSVRVGTGNRLDNTSNTVDNFFSPGAPINCEGGGSQSASLSLSPRYLRVIVEGTTLTPDITITHVPFAINAMNAEKFGSHGPNDFLLKAGLPTCATNTYLTYDGANLTCAAVAGGSNGTVTSVTSSNSYLTVANNSTTPVLTLNVGTGANTVAAGDDVRFSDSRTPSGAAGGDLAGTYPNPTLSTTGVVASTYTKVTVDSKGRVTAGASLSVGDIPDLPYARLSGQTTGQTLFGGIDSGGTLVLESTSNATKGFVLLNPNGGNVGIGVTSPSSILDINGPMTVQGASFISQAGAGQGRIYFDSSANKFRVSENGSAYVDLVGAGGGSVNSVTASSPLASSGGTAPNITITQATSSTDGYLSSADWNTFNSKLGTGTSFVGDVSGSYNATFVDKIKGKSVVPVTYTSGQVLRYDGANWVNAVINASTDISGIIAIGNGGTGATTALAARSNLGLGTVATYDFGSAAGYVPLLGTGGLVANQMCTSDGTGSGIICNTTIPSSPWLVNGSSIYYSSGSVGIGTSAPNGKLDVHNGDLFVTNDIGGAKIFALGPSGSSLILRNTNTPTAADIALGSIRFSSDIYEPAGIEALSSESHSSTKGSYLKFLTTKVGEMVANERMRIDDSGRVAIGTSETAGTLTLQEAASAASLFLRTNDFVFGSAGTAFSIGLLGNSSLTTGNIQVFDSYGNPQPLTLQNNGGSVGIGTPNPQYDLELRRSTANSTPTIAVKSYSSGASYPPRLLLSNSGGNYSFPSNLAVNNSLGSIEFHGYSGSDLKGAAIEARAASAWSGGNVPTYLSFYTAGTTGSPFERMRILENGNVGIGITNPGYTLHVDGTAGLSTGTAWQIASDRRLKDIIGNYEYGLKEVLMLRTVRYHYKKDNPLKLSSEAAMTGFIAQEVQKVIPDAVKKRSDGYLELNVDPIHWATVNAVQELHGICKISQTQITHIEARMVTVEREIASLKEQNAQMKIENDFIKSENTAIKKALCELGKASFCN